MAKRSLVLVYYNGSVITNEMRTLLDFCRMINLVFYIENDISLENLKRMIEENVEMIDGQRVSHIKYKLHFSLGIIRIAMGHSNFVITYGFITTNQSKDTLDFCRRSIFPSFFI